VGGNLPLREHRWWQFHVEELFGSTNEDFGSSGISLSDLNRDGRPDILYSNGDGFGYADPGKRPWHGLQWLEIAAAAFSNTTA